MRRHVNEDREGEKPRYKIVSSTSQSVEGATITECSTTSTRS